MAPLVFAAADVEAHAEPFAGLHAVEQGAAVLDAGEGDLLRKAGASFLTIALCQKTARVATPKWFIDLVSARGYDTATSFGAEKETRSCMLPVRISRN